MRRGPSSGFTIIEMVIGLIVAVVLVGFLFILLAKPGCTGVGGVGTCSARQQGVVRSWQLWASDYGDLYPFVEQFSFENGTSPATSSAQPGNSTANLHAVMIWNNYYSPGFVICPRESNRWIKEHQDFDYMIGGWDYDFSCDITGTTPSARTGKYFSNVSYANLDPLDKRLRNRQWQQSPATLPLLADRGAKDGVFNTNSLSLVNHGARSVWKGVITFADGHTETVTIDKDTIDPFTFPSVQWTDPATGITQPDNIFRRDDPASRSDIFLAVFGGPDGQGGQTPLWDQ